jgi:hypothetical protein
MSTHGPNQNSEIRGCRIEKADFDDAATQLKEWYESINSKLFPATTGLLSLTTADFDMVEGAFKGLVDRPACKRKTFAKVPTAKVLFALRPHALMPWDRKILSHFGLNGTASHYRRHLLWAKERLQEVSGECTKRGFELTDLPTKMERPKSKELTVPSS